jgi:DNA-binding NarL/FixJ family response regulator
MRSKFRRGSNGLSAEKKPDLHRIGVPLRVAFLGDEQGALTLPPDAFLNHWVFEVFLRADEALTRIPADPPDVLLVDVPASGTSIADCARKLRVVLPALRMIVLSFRAESQNIFAALVAGACGYLVKPVRAEELRAAVLAVAGGWTALCKEAERAVVQHLNSVRTGSLVDPLTPREAQIISFLLSNLSDKQIAQALCITPGTVHVHLANLYKKLQAHDREEAVQKFLCLKE